MTLSTFTFNGLTCFWDSHSIRVPVTSDASTVKNDIKVISEVELFKTGSPDSAAELIHKSRSPISIINVEGDNFPSTSHDGIKVTIRGDISDIPIPDGDFREYRQRRRQAEPIMMGTIFVSADVLAALLK